MPLPEILEIIPAAAPITARVAVPGSKSITNRALVLAALATGKTRLDGALWSEDTQVMTDCLRALGFEVEVQQDPAESCNRTITVQGLGGRIPNAGTAQSPVELFVGNAGTAARFLSAMVCVGHGFYRLHGVPRMHERPQSALFSALRQLGYRISCNNDRLPAVFEGTGPRPGSHATVSLEESSQFASALLLAADIGGWTVAVQGENAEESPYVEMTRRLVRTFPASGGCFQIEPDASSGSYFWAVNPIQELRFSNSNGRVEVPAWPDSGWQIDAAYPRFARPSGTISRQTDLGDSIMTAIVVAAAGKQRVRFTDLGRLRVQECERVVALRTELTKCGALIHETGDTLEIDPAPNGLHGVDIHTYNDHRMAMCFAILGLLVPGIRLLKPACVKKTFPNFFQKLASPSPAGLGVTLLDGNQRTVPFNDLFAD